MKTKTVVTEVKRYIGIRPRIKGSGREDSPPRPTQVCILTPTGEGDKLEMLELDTEQDELDWICHTLATGYRDVLPGENVSTVPSHLVKRDDPKEAAKQKRPVKPDRIPVGYTGLEAGDLAVLSLGGIGDLLAYSIWRNGEKAGFTVKRIPPYRLKEEREKAYLRREKISAEELSGILKDLPNFLNALSKDDDAELLARLIKESPGLFRDLAERDLAMVELRETERQRRFAQKDRKACAMRVRSAARGEVFCSKQGGYPEGGLEKVFKLALASDPVLKALKKKETRLNGRLRKACEQIPIYNVLREIVVGAGPAILGSVIAALQDIGLFDTPGKMKAFCGIHVKADGSFPRHLVGQKCNWNPNARQAFFLLGDQFNRRAGTFWGARLLANKAEYKRKHPHPILKATDGKRYPLIDGQFKKKGNQYTINQDNAEPIKVSGKQEFFNGHLLKMASWKTVQEFAEWLYWKWRRLDGYPARLPRIYPSEDEEEIKQLQAEQAPAPVPVTQVAQTTPAVSPPVAETTPALATPTAETTPPADYAG
jgi:hypothetical protein